MKKLLIIIIAVLLASATDMYAQYTFAGKVEYERKFNVGRRYADMDEDDKKWAEKFKSMMPKFHINYYDLYFSHHRSIYKFNREGEGSNNNLWFATPPDITSTVYTDTKAGTVKVQKQLYDDKYFLQDSMRRLKWKITDEIRTIASYKCRKAVSKICDSVYVVAFYTEDIPISSGPEMMSGLPGLILELAVPRLYTTWIATKVELTPPVEKDFELSEKGKKGNMKQLHDIISGSTRDWGGGSSQRMVWWSTL